MLFVASHDSFSFSFKYGFRSSCMRILGANTYQGSYRDWKMKVVMEKLWNINSWPKVMEFHD